MKKWMLILWLVVFVFGVEDGVYRAQGYTKGVTDENGIVDSATETNSSSFYVWKLDGNGVTWLTGEARGIFWTDTDWKGDPSEYEYRYGVDEYGDELMILRYYTELGVNLLISFPDDSWIMFEGVLR